MHVHSGMPNFLRSNVYNFLPFTVFTYVSRPSATMLAKLPVHGAGSVRHAVRPIEQPQCMDEAQRRLGLLI